MERGAGRRFALAFTISKPHPGYDGRGLLGEAMAKLAASAADQLVITSKNPAWWLG